MKKYLSILLTLAVVVIAVFAGRWVWSDYMHTPWTRDGRIRAEIITVSPDVSGWVTALDVKDGQYINKGDVLFSIDATRYKAALDKSKANTENMLYTWQLAKHKLQRRKGLNAQQAISEETLESTRINTKIAQANYELAKSEQTIAQLNYDRTTVIAPVSGQVINLNLRQGNYVTQAKPVFAIVKSDSFYVTGYFEETKIPLIHTHQKAKIALLSGGKMLTGKVVSIGNAIANTNTQGNSELLPQVQQTFNWVRLSQRIPVDIKLDPLPKNTRLSAGMTVTIHLNTD